MKKTLTALFALALAFVFGTATLAYAEAPADNGTPSASVKKDEKVAPKKKVKKAKKKVMKKKKKVVKKAKKEEMNEGAPAAPAK